MKTNAWIKFSLVLCLVGFSVPQALAFNGIGRDWRDQYPDSCQELQDATTAVQDCRLCHTSGFGFNPYGKDLKENNNDFFGIEGLDSDGDGRTNGEEINIDCTFPGDAISPAELDSWGYIKALFR